MSLRLSLQRHPDTPCGLTGIEVEVARASPRALHLTYVLLGGVRKIRMKPREQDRGDPLWRHTCLEAFLRPGGGEGYYELNLAPSGDWAAYGFTGYREGMEAARALTLSGVDGQTRILPLDAERRAQLEAVEFDTYQRFEPSFFLLKAQLTLDPSIPIDVPWHLGLSAVIEERNGRISYWALRHPPGKPDFHHPDCFALELPAARPT
jgi:hypothetical protein